MVSIVDWMLMEQDATPDYTQTPSAAPHFKALSKWHLNEMIIDTQIRWRGAVVAELGGGSLWWKEGSVPNLQKGGMVSKNSEIIRRRASAVYQDLKPFLLINKE